jgi:PAS domain S-box-containing protein
MGSAKEGGDELSRALHELQVYRVELEAQNHELRRSRDALEASRARYADLFDFAPIGYMTLDREQRIAEVNLTGAELFGYDRAELVGKPLSVLARFESSYVVTDHVHECLARSLTVRAEFSFTRCSDGARVTVQAVSAPVLGFDGVPTGCRTALFDVTERKNAERERECALDRERAARWELEAARRTAEEASRTKDEFLSVLSHELRTPLNAMLGWSHMLESGQFSSVDQLRRGLAAIRRNAETQRGLVEDIVDISRIITGKLRIELGPVRLGGVVRAAVESLQAAAQLNRVALSVSAPVDPRVMGDAERLRQVVWNLVSNALTFTPPGGRVHVAVSAEDDAGLVTVKDTGAGVPSAGLPWMLDRLWQIGDGASPGHLRGGHGLSLAIVRHIVELHGGRVWGETDGAGGGSTFSVAIPSAPLGAGRSAVPRSPVLPSPLPLDGNEHVLLGVRVLVVDDNDDARQLAAALLEAQGASVETASSADEALRALVARPPHVLVSDLAMPGEDGLALISKVRHLPPPTGQVPAVMVTAYARQDEAQTALDAGYDEQLCKPITPAELIGAVAHLAGASEPSPAT